MREPKIAFRNVTKVFQTRSQEIVAVKDYSMQVDAGEFVSIIGPSGCGKSTLIRMLNGIIQPSSGELYIDGELVNAPSRKILRQTLRKMGFVFQQPNILPWYTIRQNVLLPLKIFGQARAEERDYADSLIEMVGLKEYANAYPLEISGGMLQRAGVIRAMVHKPEILLMDEPFGALDEMMREQLNIELLEMWKNLGITIIFITHNVEEALLLSSRIYVMGTQPGRLAETVEIGLPRPRTLSMITEKRFADYEMQLTSLIGELDLRNIK